MSISPAPITEPVARHIVPREFSLVPLRDCPWRDGLPALNTTDDAIEYFWKHCAQPPGFESHVESLHVVLLDKSVNVLGHYLVSKGTAGETIFTYPQFLLPVILAGAAGVVAIHNHPGGDTTPSPADIRHASRLQLACDFFGIDLQDFLIVGLPSRTGAAGFSSLRTLGLLNRAELTAAEPSPEDRPATLVLDLDVIPENETELRVAVQIAAVKADHSTGDYLTAFLLARLRAEFAGHAVGSPSSPALSAGEEVPAPISTAP